MKNAERILVASLKRYAARTGVELQLLSGDWVAVLGKPGRRHLVMGYDLGLNGSAASRIANDKGAVSAAITQPWSNGQVEAQITKLKLVKRQMYGRGKVDLLQARLIGTA